MFGQKLSVTLVTVSPAGKTVMEVRYRPRWWAIWIRPRVAQYEGHLVGWTENGSPVSPELNETLQDLYEDYVLHS